MAGAVTRPADRYTSARVPPSFSCSEVMELTSAWCDSSTGIGVSLFVNQTAAGDCAVTNGRLVFVSRGAPATDVITATPVTLLPCEGVVTTTLAPANPTYRSVTSAAASVSNTTQAAPAFQAPSVAIAKSNDRGSCTPTRLPGETPCSINNRA